MTAPTTPAPTRRPVIRVGPRLAGSPLAQAEARKRGRKPKYANAAEKQKAYRERKQQYLTTWKEGLDLVAITNRERWEDELTKLKKKLKIDKETEADLEKWWVEVTRLKQENETDDKSDGRYGPGIIMRGAPSGKGELVTGGYGHAKVGEVDAAHERDEKLGGKRNKIEGCGKDEDEPLDPIEEKKSGKGRPGFINEPRTQDPERRREKSALLEIEVRKVIDQNSHVIHRCRVCSLALEGRDDYLLSKYRQVFDHIQEHHPQKMLPETGIESVYYCDFEDGRQRCPETFDNEVDLAAHMQEVHGRAFRRAQRALRKKPITTQRPMPQESFRSEAEINVLRALDDLEDTQMGLTDKQILKEGDEEDEDQADDSPAPERELKPIS